MENNNITTQFCRKCGVKIPGDSVFCPKCGERVVSVPTKFDFPIRSSPVVQTACIPQPKRKKTTSSIADIAATAIGGIMFIFFVLLIVYVVIIAVVEGPENIISKPGVEVITAPPVTSKTAPSNSDEMLKPQGRPYSGTISIGHGYDDAGDSKITVHASSKNCVVKLRTTDGITILSFFVRANESATVGVPAKKLYAYFAEGDTWYGWSDYFGEDTSYSKDPDPIDFSQYAIEYTLYDVYNGNLNLSRIDEDEF